VRSVDNRSEHGKECGYRLPIPRCGDGFGEEGSDVAHLLTAGSDDGQDLTRSSLCVPKHCFCRIIMAGRSARSAAHVLDSIVLAQCWPDDRGGTPTAAPPSRAMTNATPGGTR
jgi:hypothetical protein